MMPIEIWPLVRPLLVMLIMLSVLYEPRKKDKKTPRDKKRPGHDEEVYDAEYEQLGESRKR